MDDYATLKPAVPELFYASLVASGIVYLSALGLFTILELFSADAGRLQNALGILLVFGMHGAPVAIPLPFLIVAPLGTAIGLFMVRDTRPGPWPGPRLR
jgi:hypothetical protein